MPVHEKGYEGQAFPGRATGPLSEQIATLICTGGCILTMV